MNKMFIAVAVASLPLLPANFNKLYAQDKLTVTPIGRIHVDGALNFPSKDGFHDGASLPEIRAGVKAMYAKWMARIEVGYSYGKIGMKDVYIQRGLGENDYLRLGYFIPQFGIRGGGSASYKPAMIAQVTESFFRTMTRKIGVGYTRYSPDYFISASAFVGGRSLTFSSTEQGKVSAGGAIRGVWHPVARPGAIAHIGFSASYETASHTRLINDSGDEEASSGFRTYSASFPTTVSKVPMLEAHVTDAVGDWKLSPEITLSKDRFALESQFYYMKLPRHNNVPSYHAVGTYGMVRCLLFGDKEYRYSNAEGALALPSPKTLELIAGYDYTNADTHAAGIDGGISNDWNLTLNYYINKYMIARLRYSYTDVRNSSVCERRGVNIIQARLQFVF